MNWTWPAIGWTLLYVASKAHYAIEGRLGVLGGPAVDPARYAGYGPGEVSQAQWANAAAGLGIALLLLGTALPLGRRLPRWLLVVPLWASVAMAAAGAVGMTGRALVSDDGGAGFGAYCAVWTVLLAATTLRHQRRFRPAVASVRACGFGDDRGGDPTAGPSGHLLPGRGLTSWWSRRPGATGRRWA